MDNERFYKLLANHTDFTEKMVKAILEKDDFSISSCELFSNVVPCMKAVTDHGDEIFIYGSQTDVSPTAARICSSQACYDAGEFRDHDIYLIFFCDHDYFETGDPVTWIISKEMNTGITFDDGLYMIYVNCRYEGDSGITGLLQELNSLNTDAVEKENCCKYNAGNLRNLTN